MNIERSFKEQNNRDETSFSGYRVLEFAPASKDTLKEVAEVLIPHEEEIVRRWVEAQYKAYQPPTYTRQEIEQVFGDIFHDMLSCMLTRQLEQCIKNLEKAGADLARRDFPYEALIISLHFLEESYLPFLLKKPSDKAIYWLLQLDEFLHAALAAIATSYFQVYRKALLEEAEVGRLVQEGLLPDIPSKAIDLDIAHIYIPSGVRTRVGGDLVDLIQIDPHEAAFIVGDLSGHGLEAATDAAMLRYLFRGFMRERTGLVETMDRLNRILKDELPSGHFATALAGTYKEPGHLRLVSAGHPEPILCTDNCRLLEPGGIALGIEEEAVFSLYETRLDMEGVFVAYTDGLIEARGKEGFFGVERVTEIASQKKHLSAGAIAENLKDEAIRFTGGRLTDDVAILVLKRVGLPSTK
ncbi:MAG: serine/threonine-protein phosphatase [Firmicutes bacterium]|nr:serine/threonine-protein phosphatase [Bacillota bacterium]